jgi:hypothetical protein
MRTLLIRVIVPVALAWIAIAGHRAGGDMLPNWLANLSVKTGLGVDRAVRLVTAFAIVGAALGFLSARRAPRVAWITCSALAFTALAELSAIIAAPGNRALPGHVWTGPLISAALGGGGLWVLSRPHAAVPVAARFTVWRLAGTLAVLMVAFGVAGRMNVTPRTDVSLGAGGVEAVSLDASQWVGKSFAAAGVAIHAPLLTPATLSGTKWVVFYRPNCGRCHQILDTYFAGPQGGNVVAVKVPYGPGEEQSPSDMPEEVRCEECERIELPSGKRWIITTPTIAKVEDGVITCVTWTDYDRCRTPSEIAAAEAAPQGSPTPAGGQP